MKQKTREELELELEKLKKELADEKNWEYKQLRADASGFLLWRKPAYFPKAGWEKQVTCDHAEPVQCYGCQKILCNHCQSRYFNEFWTYHGWLYECGNCEAVRHKNEIEEKRQKLEKKKVAREKLFTKLLKPFRALRNFFRRSPSLPPPSCF